MRSFSSAIIIFFQHALGDVISPPIIGAISDKSSLRNGLQVTWVMILLSGCIWFYGYIFLEPLLLKNSNNDGLAVRKFADIFRKEVEVEVPGEGVENLAALRDREDELSFESEIFRGMIMKNPMIRVSTSDEEEDEEERGNDSNT